MLNSNIYNNCMKFTKLSKSGENKNEEIFARYMYEVAYQQDKQAFGEIFKYFAPRLKSYFIKAGAIESQAEEIIQEVMIAIWTKASSYDRKKSSVSTWIYTIARNKRIDKIRKEKRHYMQESDEGLEMPIPSTQEQDIFSVQLTKKIENCLQSLPIEQAELLKLSYFYEKTRTDISKELKIPLGTVKSRIRLALNKMKNMAEIN